MSKNTFNTVIYNKPKKNKFDLSHEKKMSMKMGPLYPFYLEEIVPGDSFNVDSEIFLRFAPMLAPIMHRIKVYTHYFFVPNRLTWNEWEEFITGGEDGNSEPAFPRITVQSNSWENFTKGTLADYLNIPLATSGAQSTGINALPFRAYQLIYNEYYRDQNLIEKIDFGGIGDSPVNADLEDLCLLRERAWEKDYFTSCLPWSQRGGEAIVPMKNFKAEYDTYSTVYDSAGNPQSGQLSGAASPLGELEIGATSGRLENINGGSGEILINDLRKATRLQEWLEKSARGGSRYIEQILSHFGVKSSDARLQRPEYLGGGTQNCVISEVLNTTGTDLQGSEAGYLPQGEMAGHGISVGKNNGFRKSFEEHGFVIGIISVIPKTCYQQGLARTWRKFDKFDYFWPEFAHLGEQEVYRSEIYQTWEQGDSTSELFGYQQRYAEYKYKETQVSGDFRDNLDFWHLGRQFEVNPFLNGSFVTCRPDNRIFAVTENDVDNLYVQIYNKVHAVRPMPYFAIPTL